MLYINTAVEKGSQTRMMTFLPDPNGAGGFDPLAVFEPLSRDTFQRQLTHEHGILILLDVQILQTLDDLKLWLCLNKQKQAKQTEKINHMYNCNIIML